MSKIVNVLFVSAIALGISACTPNPVKVDKVVDCTFPGSEKPAPVWVCHGQPDGWPIFGVGSYPKSGAGYQYMTDQAALAARIDLATQARSYMEGLVTNSINTTGLGPGAGESVDAAAKSVKSQLTDGDLVGAKIVRALTGPDGTMYVLVGMDAAVAEKVVEKAVKSSMGNEKALWQQFLAGKNEDEMAAKIAKHKQDEKQAQ